MTKPTPQSVANEIDGLGTLHLETLRAKWTELFAIAPLPRISRDLLIRGISYRLQEEMCAGLSKSARRRLGQLGKELAKDGSLAGSQTASFKPGTKLIREWKGRVHEVVIAGDTYIYAGQHYRSLSQIARDITGTRWSGPRFFGLEVGNTSTAPRACNPSAVKSGMGTSKTQHVARGERRRVAVHG